MPKLLPIAQQGEPILEQRAAAVTDVHDPAIQTLIDAMQTTMEAANGVGIAAPQVYVGLRIIIVASRPNKRYPDAPWMQAVAMINPEITWHSPETAISEEGCLSVADFRTAIQRPERVRVRYTDRWGAPVEAAYSGFIARIVQHECDHLDGILFPSRCGVGIG